MNCPNCCKETDESVYCSKECADDDPVFYTADDGGQYEGWDPLVEAFKVRHRRRTGAVITHVEWGVQAKGEGE